MFKIFKLLLVFILLILLNCDNSNNQNIVNRNDTTFNINEIPLNSTYELEHYRDLAIEKGDTNAYIELSMEYMESSHYDFLYTALIMANKYNFHEAYYDVYYCLTHYYYEDEYNQLDGMDDKTRTLALDYLRLGAKLGDHNCMRALSHHLRKGIYFPKDTARANMLNEKVGD